MNDKDNKPVMVSGKTVVLISSLYLAVGLMLGFRAGCKFQMCIIKAALMK